MYYATNIKGPNGKHCNHCSVTLHNDLLSTVGPLEEAYQALIHGPIEPLYVDEISAQVLEYNGLNKGLLLIFGP